MKDLLEELEESLKYMFELQTKKTGQYINLAVQNLRNALDNYKDGPSISLQELIIAMKLALPNIEKYTDVYQVMNKMDSLAAAKGETIIWETIGPSVSEKNGFISWLSTRTGTDFASLDNAMKANILVAERAESEFMTKLAQYLCKNPEFLVDIVLVSPETFMQIMGTRIGFQLENKQLARVIYHHMERINDKAANSSKQVEQFLRLLDEELSKTGHSIEKLLIDPDAKAELEKSGMFSTVLKSFI